MHRCPNRACPSRGLESLINWVQAAADIEGVGEQSVRRLWELGLVRSLPELYRLTKEQLIELEGYGEISATNAIESIQASKAIPFNRVLFGLNIPDVGWVTAQNLARHFENVDRLLDATQEDVTEVDGIGPDRAESIADGSRTSRTARWSPSFATSVCASRSGRRTSRRKGRSPGTRTSSPARSRRSRASRRAPRSRRWARRSTTPSRRRRPAWSSARSPATRS